MNEDGEMVTVTLQYMPGDIEYRRCERNPLEPPPKTKPKKTEQKVEADVELAAAPVEEKKDNYPTNPK